MLPEKKNTSSYPRVSLTYFPMVCWVIFFGQIFFGAIRQNWFWRWFISFWGKRPHFFSGKLLVLGTVQDFKKKTCTRISFNTTGVGTLGADFFSFSVVVVGCACLPFPQVTSQVTRQPMLPLQPCVWMAVAWLGATHSLEGSWGKSCWRCMAWIKTQQVVDGSMWALSIFVGQSLLMKNYQTSEWWFIDPWYNFLHFLDVLLLKLRVRSPLKK